MKRIFTSLSIALLATCMLASTSVAQEGTMPDWADKTGGFGVGAETTMGGTNGLNLRYYVSNMFGLQLTFGMLISNTTVAVDGGDDIETGITGLGFGIYGSYKLAYWQRGSLSAIAGIDIHTLGITDGGDDPSGTDILLGLGLQGEVFLSQYFSVFGQVGIRIDFIGEDEVEGSSLSPNVDTSGIDLSLGGDLLGAFGFTVWFQ